jgi:cytochrome bd-type quinol oxidase subunit 2
VTDDDRPPSGGRLKPVSPGVITGWAVVGLVVGWLIHRIGESWRGTAPVISWAQPVILVLLAAIMAGTAWITWRQVQVRHERIESYRAVNRLVLGRACAYVGALLGGGYLGYAVSWLGLAGDPIAHAVALKALVAAAAGGVVCLSGVLLERACRIRDDDESPG